jgi:hypothetical protein|tara:strand:+ start:234 stop:497 length:264 start_codon:yes stop_codon:yes gene_type:complete
MEQFQGFMQQEGVDLTQVVAEGGGEPPPGPPPFEFVGGLQATMPGETGWGAVLDLAPGDYALVCFVEDPETGAPHAALGMTSSFTVQ